MIEIRLSEKVKFAIDFTFFAAIALFFFFDENGYGLMGICACIVHEIGHLFVLFIEKRDFKSLTLYGGGVKINYEKKADASVLLVAAGSLLNFAVFVILYFFFPANFYANVFAVINLIIGIFNFLPFKYFDGGLLLEKILIKLLDIGKALFILRKTEQITAFITIVCAILFIASIRINISVVVVIFYIIISDIAQKIK